MLTDYSLPFHATQTITCSA